MTKRLRTIVQEMTKTWRTAQEMTTDLWGGGGSGYLNLTGTRYLLPQSCSLIFTCSSIRLRHAVFPASASVGAQA
ncbi:unnamed protein product [Staurois parvus]|uniref:Uncharacterized protein n=1 Tax=Staurois parvus TaxID=386267 RepID=A0ABN9HLS4_9NEOB|nr:unnamed protein product [Staurois parvus]